MCVSSVWAALGTNDVAVVRVNSSTDGFSVLALRDLARTETLYWTDDGWTQSRAFRMGEGDGTLDILTQDIPCGTVFDVPASSLSCDGDQIFLFTGGLSAPSLLWGVDWGNTAGWDADATSPNTSADPAATGGALTDSQSVSLGSQDWHRYTGGRTGTVEQLVAWISDSTNWSAVDSTNWGEGGFHVATSYGREGQLRNSGAQVPAGGVSALVTNASTAVPVLRFALADAGSGDGLPLKALQLVFQPAAGNTAAWADVLAGLVLSNETDHVVVSTGAAWITDAFAALPVSAGALEVSDGESKVLCLYAYWRPGGVIDGAAVAFGIPALSHGCVAVGEGSSAFTADFGSAVTGGPQTIAVTATELRFVSVPQHAEVDRAFAVMICACDAAGNVDAGETASVALDLASGSGMFSGGSALPLSGGSNRWTSLRYEATGAFALRASAAGLGAATSPWIDAVAPRVALTGGSCRIAFDSLATSGLPAGVLVYTNATSDSLGVMAAFSSSAKAWSDSGGAFKNVASTSGLASASSTSAQAVSPHRALGVRQSASFGDPGAAIVIGVQNTAGFGDLTVSLDLLMLTAASRSTTWTIDYRIGDTGPFVPVSVWSDPGIWGGTRVSVLLPGTRNRQDPVYIRIAALDPSTGSGTRDTIAVDNIEIACRRIIPAGTLFVFR